MCLLFVFHLIFSICVQGEHGDDGEAGLPGKAGSRGKTGVPGLPGDQGGIGPKVRVNCKMLYYAFRFNRYNGMLVSDLD